MDIPQSKLNPLHNYILFQYFPIPVIDLTKNFQSCRKTITKNKYLCHWLRPFW